MAEDNQKTFKFEAGGVWNEGHTAQEESGFNILKDYVEESPGVYRVHDIRDGETPFRKFCKHMRATPTGGTMNRGTAKFPWVVEAFTSGGFLSTGVCLMCILEAAEELGIKARQEAA